MILLQIEVTAKWKKALCVKTCDMKPASTESRARSSGGDESQLEKRSVFLGIRRFRLKRMAA